MHGHAGNGEEGREIKETASASLEKFFFSLFTISHAAVHLARPTLPTRCEEKRQGLHAVYTIKSCVRYV